MRPKLLIVDDRPENLVALETVLKGLEIELIKVTNGNDALKATLYHNFALALLDIQMPEMDGYELASILRESEQTSNLPFIFISAVYTDNLNVFKGYECGAFSFITKPFQPEVLLNKVNFFLEKHRQEVELREMNDKLEQKNADLEFVNSELEAFSYSVSHDLRAPLRAIDGYARMLAEDCSHKLSDDEHRYLNAVQENATKMGNLIDGLLTFSRLGKKPIELNKVDLKKMVEDVWHELQRSARSDVIFKIHTLPPVRGDYDLLKQVMINLISNAIKYSSKKEKPEIEIGFEIQENETAFYVKDNGAGFNMEYANKLFGVFQRLHSPAEFEGNGVGLALVQRIVNKHGGKIWADAETGKGATFWFTLP
ncbi:MAG: sensor histidine kinase [Bacteroidota bacterium]